MNPTTPIPYDQAVAEAYRHYHANSYGWSEYQEQDYKSGYADGYNAAMNNIALRKQVFKEQWKYYFVSYYGNAQNGAITIGHTLLKTLGITVTELSVQIQQDHNLAEPAILLNLHMISEEEFEMLNPENTPQQ